MDLPSAAEIGNLDRVRSLVEQGADKDKGDSFGQTTPLYLATRNGHFQVVQYLVEQVPSLDKAGGNDWTALIGAVYSGRLEIARYLLEQGADRDKASNYDKTPLHYAAANGHLEIALLLMSYGADLNAKDMFGRLPIDMPSATEEIKQAIRDEPRRRMDEAPGKRATEQDRHLNASSSASAQQEEENGEEDEEQSNNRPRLDEGAVAGALKEAKVAEEDEDSEPSSDEGKNN